MSNPPAQSTGSVASQSVTAGMYPQRWKALTVLVIGLLVVILDNTILNVALKTIQEDLGATQNELVWAINAYSLAFAALLVTWGVLGDRFGRKKILLIGLVLFGAASALCAFATSPGELIAFRALMGIGGASVMPISLSIITVIFPPQERGKAIGVWAAAVGGAVALGPVLGGLLLEHPNWFQWLTGNDWGSVFFINVPIVIIGIIGIIMLVPETKNPRPGKLDPLGLVLSVVGLFADHLRHPECVVRRLGLAEHLGLHRRRRGHPARLRLLRAEEHPPVDRSLAVQDQVVLRAADRRHAGLRGHAGHAALPDVLLPDRPRLVAAAGRPAGPAVRRRATAGRAPQRQDGRPVRRPHRDHDRPVFALAGMLCFGFVTQETPVWFLVILGVVFGFGLGNTIAPSTTRMTLATPPERSGAGSAVQNTVRQIGAVFGVAILSSVVGTVYSNNITPLISDKGLPPEALAAATDSIGGTTEVASALAKNGVPQSSIDQLLQAANQSFLPALHTAAFVSAGLLVIAIAVILLRLPAKAEAVAWAGSGPGSAPTGDQSAENRVHTVDEMSASCRTSRDSPLAAGRTAR